jgi:hypothetical protein
VNAPVFAAWQSHEGFETTGPPTFRAGHSGGDGIFAQWLSLPYALVADRTLHTHTMHRRYPALAHLPFDAKRKGADDRHGIRRSAAALLAFALEARSAAVDTQAVALRAARAVASGSSAHIWFLSRMVQLLDVERRYTEFTGRC